MSGGHAHAVDPTRPLDGPIERLAPEAKIVGTVAFAVAVVSTPAHVVWPYLAQLAVVAVVAVVALLPLRVVARRLVFEIPFVALGVAMLLVGGEPTIALGPLSISEPGAWSAWTILARSTLGVLAASILASTTTADELLAGLGRLHLPRVITTISSFAVRYMVVLRDELDRMRLAQALRSGGRRLHPRDIASLGAVLFVRSFERGERVHIAMSTRGPGSSGPSADARALRAGTTSLGAGGTAGVAVLDRAQPRASGRAWLVALAPAATAAAIAGLAWVLR